MRSHRVSHRRAARPALTAGVGIILLAATAACATGGGDGNGGSEDARDRPVTVEVENQSWNTVHVYVLAGGQYQSLGQLSSQNTERYGIPRGMLGQRKEIRLAADPIGSRGAFISDRIFVEPGDAVSWTLTEPLAHSRVFVN